MLEIPRRLLDPPQASSVRPILLGVGNAGVALVDRLTMAGYAQLADLVAVNCDSASLMQSVANNRIQIGPRTARGLGAGGDPDLAADALEESADEIIEAIQGASLVLLCAGLGGGCGSGASPLIAKLAKRSGALVLGVFTLPFSFEGRRRIAQAEAAAQALRGSLDAAFGFANDRMSDLVEPLEGIHETFSAADRVLAECYGSILGLAAANGPLRVSISDLAAIFQSRSGAALFGCGRSSGKNRAHEAVEGALKCPLMDRGRLLAEAGSVLVHIEGPESLTLAEIQVMMRSVAKEVEDTSQIHLSTNLLSEKDAPLAISILATLGVAAPAARPEPARAEPVRVEIRSAPAPAPVDQPAGEDLIDAPPSTFEPAVAEPALASETVPDPPQPTQESAGENELFNTEPFSVTKPATSKKSVKAKQETLSLDPATRGRFEKSEPTIVEGEDLDVPAFLRQKVRLK